MITLFEDYTAKLSDEEMQALPYFREYILSHVGREKAVTNTEISRELRRHTELSWTDARVRKFINRVRCSGFIRNLIATSRGYYISNDKEEIGQYIESLWGRITAIKTVIDSLECQRDEMGQAFQGRLF